MLEQCWHKNKWGEVIQEWSKLGSLEGSDPLKGSSEVPMLGMECSGGSSGTSWCWRGHREV